MNLSDIVDRAAAEQRTTLNNSTAILSQTSDTSNISLPITHMQANDPEMVVTTTLPGYSFAFSPIPPAQASATAWLERAKAVYGDQSKIFLLPQRSPYPSVFPPHPLAPPALIDPYLLQQNPKKKPISNQVTLQQVSHNLQQQQQQQTKSPHETQQLNLPIPSTSNSLRHDRSSLQSTPSSPFPTVQSSPLLSSPSSSRLPQSNGLQTNNNNNSNSSCMTMTLPIVRQSTDQSKNLKVNKEAIEKYGKLTVTGKNVSEDNIVEGYIQFILQHDPYYFNSMEAVSTAERKISTVPKTNLYGISYTTWDLFRLIQKLQKGDIKNWSQLVAMLGLQNVAGRAQFAQRIKRWMHRYKIDCYFNYLLGNEYDFNDPESDKNKSILSFNFNTKRKVKEKPESNEGDELEGEMETDYLKEYEGDVDDDDHKPKPIILPPGGRKRLRINSDPERLIQVAKNFIKRRRCDDSDVDEKEMENDATDEIESEAESEIETTATINGEHQEGSVISKSSKDKDILDESEEPVQRDEDGEDELESSASSSGSPVMEEVFNNNRKASSCSNCHMLESEVELLKKEIANLKLYISVVEDNLSRQKKATEASQQYINQLLLEKLKLRGYYTKWKQKLAKDILNGPVIPEDE